MSNGALPDGWVNVPLGDAGAWSGGGTPSKGRTDFWEGGVVPWVSPKDMKCPAILDTEDHVTEAALAAGRISTSPVGTVLVVVRSGILAHTLPIAVARVPVTMNQDMKGIAPTDGLLPDYLAHFLKANEREILQSCTKTGTTVSSVEMASLKRIELRLAPLPEQRRIVEKIEELFSLLDAGVAALERVRANLKRYRASVLKAAVEGRLTEEWRAKHPDTEPASVLLQRILHDRRRQWEQDQPAKFAQKGQKPPAGWQAKYKEPAPPDTTDLPELPEGWVWASPDQLAAPEPYSLAIGPFGSNLKVSDYAPSGVPLVFVRNIRSGSFGDEETPCVSEAKAAELRAHRTDPGDILITKMGDPPGDTCVYPEHCQPAIITADCVKLRVAEQIPEPAYFAYCIRSDTVHRLILGITRGVAQTKISLGRFRSIALPLPPVPEQTEIVAEVERRLSVVDEIEAETDAGLRRAARLRQSILKRAFEGNLVPQDPNDEPASVLLDRIKAERATANPTAPRRSKKGYTGEVAAGQPASDVRQNAR